MKKYLPLLLFLAAVAWAADVARIAPKDAAALVGEGKAVLVDVREPAEWAKTGVAAPAALLPKSDFDGARKLWKEFLATTGNREIILYCHSGHRAGIVGAALAATGLKVANAGAFKDWEAAGLPVRKVAPGKP